MHKTIFIWNYGIICKLTQNHKLIFPERYIDISPLHCPIWNSPRYIMPGAWTEKYNGSNIFWIRYLIYELLSTREFRSIPALYHIRQKFEHSIIFSFHVRFQDIIQKVVQQFTRFLPSISMPRAIGYKPPGKDLSGSIVARKYTEKDFLNRTKSCWILKFKYFFFIISMSSLVYWQVNKKVSECKYI